MLSFGSGNFYGIAAGSTVATPRKFGTLQDVTFDITASTKQLFGQSQFPVDIRRGEIKFTGKAKFAQINAGIVNDLFFNQSSSTGVLLSAVGESAQIPSSTPWTVTVQNAATFDTDLGVIYAATGAAFTKVSGSPTIGEYSESAGVYTFSTSDAGVSVLIDYLYTSPTGGTKVALTNQQMGTQPTFLGVFTTTISGKTMTMKLNACTTSKLSIGTKIQDYTIPEMDFEVMADSGNNIGTISMTS